MKNWIDPSVIDATWDEVSKKPFLKEELTLDDLDSDMKTMLVEARMNELFLNNII